MVLINELLQKQVSEDSIQERLKMWTPERQKISGLVEILVL